MKRGIDELVDPAFFLHRIDLGADRASFVRTDRRALRDASFLDGRSIFWTKSAVERRLSSLLGPRAPNASPDRFIFHMGFCGSTLLSRLLDHPGRALVLREPQALTDIAAYKSALDRVEGLDERVKPTLGLARDLLNRRWVRPEAIVIKPSNWINNLLPHLCADPNAIRPLFLTIDRRSFLCAIFRGGSNRLAFAARAALHLSHSGTARAASVATALARPVDQLDKLATLAALLHRFQLDLFAAAGWPDTHWLSFAHLRADPKAAAIRAADILVIDAPPEPAGAVFQRHAKQPELGYSQEEQDAADRAIEAEHGARIDRACGWADEALPPPARDAPSA